MVHDFYQMLEEPFSVSPDPRFLYVAASHREALASLYYGVETGRGLMVLIASPGSGKTTIIHQLIGKLKPGARTVFLFRTQCTSKEMLQYLLNDLGVDVTGMETVAMYNHLYEILTEENQAGRRFVLIIDEAQNLDPTVLETIRLLSNFETSRRKLLQVLLVGQPQLAHNLSNPALDHIQQRISICTRLQPLDAEETSGYIAHRLKVAGYSGRELFTPAAMQIIKEQSRGIPRRINRLCFGALSLGFAMGRNQIDAEMMAEVVADLESERQTSEPLVSKPGRAGRTSAKTGAATPWLKQWFTATQRVRVAAVAATVLIAVGTLQYARFRMGHALPASTIVKPLSQGQLPAHGMTPVTATAGATATEGSAENALSTPEQATDDTGTTPSLDSTTVKVVVRPGETLQRIALRTLGHDSNRLIRQIQELNPNLKNPDHIEADQEIRLPQVPPEAPSVSP